MSRAFVVTIKRGEPYPAIIFAESPGKARYSRLLTLNDLDSRITSADIAVRRAPGYDRLPARHAEEGVSRESADRILRDTQAVEDWNRAHPVGTPVLVHSVLPPRGPGRETRTRSAAVMSESGHAVVWLEGIAGCYALTHVVPLAPQSPGAEP